MTNRAQKLVSLYSVIQELRVPGKQKPLGQATVYQTYLPMLEIVPVNKDGQPKTRTEEAYITEAQADEMRKAFRLMNWKKFRAAEQGSPAKG